MPEQNARPLSEVAEEIRRLWRRKDGSSSINYAAAPYLEAMRTLNTVKDSYFFDRGEDIVRYFLANANAFRGEDAKRIKEELKSHLPENNRR